MDQVHEDHLARILENRRRRGALGVYTSEASKRLYDAAQPQPVVPRREASVTAGTQTRPPPPPASRADDATSPTRPFRYPPSAHGAAVSPGSLFDTILNHSTADLRSEGDDSPRPHSTLLEDAQRGNHWGTRGGGSTPTGTDQTWRSRLVKAEEPIRKTQPFSTSAESPMAALNGPGWQRAGPLQRGVARVDPAFSAAAPSPPSGLEAQWPEHPEPPGGRRATHWRARATSPSSGTADQRIPSLAYRSPTLDDAASYSPRPSPRAGAAAAAAAATAIPPPRRWSSPRTFGSMSGLLQTPHWDESRPPPLASSAEAEAARWRSPSRNGGAYPSPSAWDRNRSTWFSRTLQESYPLPIVRDERDVFGKRSGSRVDPHRADVLSPRPARNGDARVGASVQWTDQTAVPVVARGRQQLGSAGGSRARRRAASASDEDSSSSDSFSSPSSSSSRRARGRSHRRGRSTSASRAGRRHRSRTSTSRGASRRRREDESESTASQSRQSGLGDTQPPSVDGWASRAMGRASSLNPSAAGAVVYTGDPESGAVRAFPASRNQPPRHPPRVRSFYEEAPIGLPDARSTIDIRTSVQVLTAGDWFYKWSRKGDMVHQRWIWADVKSYLLVWSRKETHDSLFSGSVPLETISQVTPRELVQADADGLPRNYYVLMIETTRRVLQIATERKEKADVWFEALNNVVAFVRRREMNKGALIPD